MNPLLGAAEATGGVQVAERHEESRILRRAQEWNAVGSRSYPLKSEMAR